MTTTALLSALAEEQQGLIEQLTGAVQLVRAGRTFWSGQLQGQAVVLALAKIGKVAAATTATLLIEHFTVDRIVFTGVAGGVGPGVEVGDVVVASDFVQHDMDASPIFARYQIPLYGRARFACDPVLSNKLQAACNAALARQHIPIQTNRKVCVHQGLIATGDRFVSSALELAGLQNALQEAGLAPLAVEMEGAAVAQVCFDYGVPFAAVRTISDRADDQAHLDFPAFVSSVASPYARAIVAQLMPML
jgi:adenosylhomocysteine nucleosidase